MSYYITSMAGDMSTSRLLLNKMQEIGAEMVRYINNRQGSQEQHYMVAYLVTEQELKDGDLGPLEDVKSKFRGIIANRDIQIRDKYIQFERFIFLMNKYDKNTGKSSTHTEKRLFDPNDTISDTEVCTIQDGGFLAKLKSDYRLIYGENKLFQMLVFTHYIPCTQEKHHCARLVDRYVKLSEYKLTIGWAEKYLTTNVEESCKTMQSENITLIQLFGLTNEELSDHSCRPVMRTFQQDQWLSRHIQEDFNRRLDYQKYDMLSGWLNDTFYFGNNHNNYISYPLHQENYNYPLANKSRGMGRTNVSHRNYF